MGIEMMYLVNAWMGADHAKTRLPANFMSRAFELNNPTLYTKDAPEIGTAACEIVRKTVKELKLGLNATHGEPTNSHTLFSRIFLPPERKFLINGQGGVAIFTQLSRPEAPAQMVSCMLLAQAKTPSNHLLEAHEYTPVFCMTGHHDYGRDNNFEMVVDSIYRHGGMRSPTDEHTKVALVYADMCFSQLLAGVPMQPEAAMKAAEALSPGGLDVCLDSMKLRENSSIQDHPAVVLPAFALEAR